MKSSSYSLQQSEGVNGVGFNAQFVRETSPRCVIHRHLFSAEIRYKLRKKRDLHRTTATQAVAIMATIAR
jgi:hypothetical protein